MWIESDIAHELIICNGVIPEIEQFIMHEIWLGYVLEKKIWLLVYNPH